MIFVLVVQVLNIKSVVVRIENEKKITIEITKDILKLIDKEAKKEYRTRTSFLVSCAMARIENNKQLEI